MEFLYTPEENDTWDPSTTSMQTTRMGLPILHEICILREFVDGYGTPQAIAANEAARSFTYLCNDDCHGDIVEKGERVGWLLWDFGIEMPQPLPAILKLVEAIPALPGIDRTEEQIRVWRDWNAGGIWRHLMRFGLRTAYERDWLPIHYMLGLLAVQRNAGNEGYWEFRYPEYAFDDEGYSDFLNANDFNALHLVAYPPDSPCFSLEGRRAFKFIGFTLEQDP